MPYGLAFGLTYRAPILRSGDPILLQRSDCVTWWRRCTRCEMLRGPDVKGLVCVGYPSDLNIVLPNSLVLQNMIIIMIVIVIMIAIPLPFATSNLGKGVCFL